MAEPKMTTNNHQPELKPVELNKYTDGLNGDQTREFHRMIEFLQKKNSREMFLLTGSAGCGKTTTISRLVGWIKDHEREFSDYGPVRICMTAPTNKAVQVLREFSIPELKKHVSFRTCHQLLGLKERITDSGELDFVADPLEPREIEGCHVVFVDEVSMLQDKLFLEIKNFNLSVKIIMLGR